MGIRDYIEDALDARRSGYGDEFVSDCPSCGREDKFYTNVKEGLMYCQRCGYSANLVKLIMEVEHTSKPAAIVKAERIKEGLASAETRVDSFDTFLELLLGAHEQTKAPVLMPRNCIPIDSEDAEEARDYLRGRGFNSTHWAPYGLQYVVSKDEDAKRFYRHIVFPEYKESGELAYWTTRAAYEPPKEFPKSYHVKGVAKDYVLGVNVAQRHKRKLVLLVEGPLDAVALSTYAVAALAKQITEQQARTLAQTFEHVAVCFDDGTSKDAIATAQRLRKLGARKVSTIACPWDDPATGVRDDVLPCVRACVARMRPFNGAHFFDA